MAKLELQFPFVLREALVVAQVLAGYIWQNLAGERREPSGSTALPVPMTARLKTSYPEPEKSVRYFEKFGSTTAYFHFDGGIAVTVTLTSWTSIFGEHWAINSVRARFYAFHEGFGRDNAKTEKIWAGEELDKLAELWGNDPHRWQDQS
ncbi:MAG: hypothetical protein A2122_02830 [Candidatus Liptonbacteria bacterium GWB1_49_6]|uniref:Uncharacterized protein n=1 Tax=Candidatus Liptonbacteria bacterium GWB1_49_6 TaxID=1798644 RepID=A0A1G2C6V8_9BACT|nr:MAG: hypothetical protein A2122_02830 [Candidatus Liptonbacteria bacterium GWB1_49_6]